MTGDARADAFKAFEAAGWSANADRYDRLTGRVSAAVVEPLLDAAGVGRGTRVLDLGTGTGATAAVAASRGARPVGVDLAEGMVEAARRLHPELEFVQGDAEALPFPDCGFDAAVAGFVLNHLPDPERAAAELHRVLGPGGGVGLAVWDVPERVGILGPLAEALRRRGRVGARRTPGRAGSVPLRRRRGDAPAARRRRLCRGDRGDDLLLPSGRRRR